MKIIDYVLKNKEWIFSGFGIIVLVGFIKLFQLFFKRRKHPVRTVRVRVHRAYFVGDTVQHYFINIVNTSNTSDVEVTHVWYEGSRRVDIIQPQRPLPRLLRPTESWETWVRMTDIPDADPFRNFRVRLSTDEVFESEERQNVQGVGFVAGA